MLNPQQTGLIFGLAAYTIWGFFPLFFHYLAHVSPLEVLSQRIIWSFLFVTAIVLLFGSWQKILTAWRSPVTRRAMLLASVLISINWLTFIWAVTSGKVLESSFGYFLTPLVSVLLARVFLGEQLDGYRLIACILAVIGVLWQIIALQLLPWISLTVACSFGLYGLVRKKANTDSLTGLGVETGLLLPLALAYWGWLEWQQSSQFLSEGLNTTLLMMASGALTAIPLLLFAAATKKLSLIAVGFMMYINPTIQFLIGVYLFNEPFSVHQLISFCFIWVALVIFSLGAVRQNKKSIKLNSNELTD
ncbi:MAG: EamA family transporter RarD [Thiolinea sp.]